MRIDADGKPAGQRTEADVSHFRHTCGLIAGGISSVRMLECTDYLNAIDTILSILRFIPSFRVRL